MLEIFLSYTRKKGYVSKYNNTKSHSCLLDTKHIIVEVLRGLRALT